MLYQQMYKHTEKGVYLQMYKHTDGHMNIQMDIQTDIKTSEHTNGCMDGETYTIALCTCPISQSPMATPNMYVRSCPT